MSSKKKSNARKGAKKSEEKQGTPDTQMQRLKIDENLQADVAEVFIPPGGYSSPYFTVIRPPA
jgi:hypothetical protein